MTILPVQLFSIQPNHTQIGSSEVVSLGERLLSALHTSGTNLQAKKLDIQMTAGVSSNAADLAKLQLKTAEYTIETNLTNTLARKSVSGIETLMKT